MSKADITFIVVVTLLVPLAVVDIGLISIVRWLVQRSPLSKGTDT